MSVTQIRNVSSLRERAALAAAAREAQERGRALGLDRLRRDEAEARLLNALRDVLGIVLTDGEPLDWSGWPSNPPTVTVERVTLRVTTHLAHSCQLEAYHPTDLPLADWLPIGALADLHPILAELDAAEVAR